MHLFYNLLLTRSSPGCRAHHRHPRRECRVQLPRRVPRRSSRSLRPAVGEEGERNGTLSTQLSTPNPFSPVCLLFFTRSVGLVRRRVRRRRCLGISPEI